MDIESAKLLGAGIAVLVSLVLELELDQYFQRLLLQLEETLKLASMFLQ